MTRSLLFPSLLVVAACGSPPRPLAATSAPPPSSRGAPAADGPAIPSPTPPGWFPIGRSGADPGSAIVANDVVPAVDAAGDPWLAEVVDPETPDGPTVRVGRATTSFALEPVPGFVPNGTLAFGLRGADLVLASTDGLEVKIAERTSGAWKTRKLPVPCRRSPSAVGPNATPSTLVDRSGATFVLCIEKTPGPYVAPDPSAIYEFGADDHPPIAAKLRFARLVGDRFVDVAAPAVSKKAQFVEAALDGVTGAIEARLDGEKAPSLALDPTSGKLVTPASTAPVPRMASRGHATFGVARVTSCFARTCTFVLGRSDAPSAPLGPLSGAWPEGVSTSGVAATEPQIALDRAGEPIVAWSEAGRIVVQRPGAPVSQIGTIDGEIARGLAVDPVGDVLVGRWGAAELRIARLRSGVATELPPLRVPPTLGAVRERTRIEATSEIHVSFPVVDGGAAARRGFVFDGDTWRSEALDDLAFDLPYPNTIARPDFWTPGRVYATRFAAHSALAFDRALHPVIAWAGDDRLHVSVRRLQWSELDADRPLASGAIDGSPALATSAHRVCVAWSTASAVPKIQVRCHGMD